MAEKKLKEYSQKRDFSKTKEPKGATIKQGSRLSFVVQHHIATREHFDLRLEFGGVLLSWAVPKGPSFNPLDKRLAVHVENHPITYQNFEGTIPKGQYGGGTVMVWDKGFYEPLTDFKNGLKTGTLKFKLFGKRLEGKWALVRTALKTGKSQAENWLLIKDKDEFAKNQTATEHFNTSVKTNRTMQEIEKGIKTAQKESAKNPFSRVDVQLAKPESILPKNDGSYIYELKYDGYRIVAFIEKGAVKLVSRNGKDYTKQFGEIAAALLKWAGSKAMVLDGEIAAAGENGKTDFQVLQNHLKKKTSTSLTYIIFDLLALNGTDLRNEPLLKRKQKLKEIMKNAPKNLNYSQHLEKFEQQNLDSLCEKNFEGIICKKANSVYSGTRNGDWIKIKCENRQEFVIGGYSISSKKTSGISSVLLGFYEGKSLIYAGRAGTGFSHKTAKEFEEKFKKIEIKKSPFEKAALKSSGGETVVFIKPKFIAEIKFTEWTSDGLLRHPSFLGLRSDKSANEVVKEITGVKKGTNTFVEGIEITSPQRTIFKNLEITKLDIANYYKKIAKKMLPYIENRIVALVRCPQKTENCFFKKHPEKNSNHIEIVNVVNSEGKTEEYFCVNTLAGLISQVQLGTIEFHVWGSKASSINKPDIMVFDLDPDEKLNLKNLRQGVKDLKSVLNSLSLSSFLKTSGGKGYHIIVPFKKTAGWEEFRAFAKNVAVLMEEKWPKRYTANVRKQNRQGKIFIDWIRNTKGATSIAPYSVRAREGAKVSAPLFWSELNKIAPDGINIQQALERAATKDPWKDFEKTKLKQQLN